MRNKNKKIQKNSTIRPILIELEDRPCPLIIISCKLLDGVVNGKIKEKYRRKFGIP